MNIGPTFNTPSSWVDPKKPQIKNGNGQLWPPHPYYYVSGSARATRMTIEASSYQTTPSCSPPQSPRCQSRDRLNDEPEDLADRGLQETTKKSKGPRHQSDDSSCYHSHSDKLLGGGEDSKSNLDREVEPGANDGAEKKGAEKKGVPLVTLTEPALENDEVKFVEPN